MWFALFPVHILFEIICHIFNPIVVLFADEEGNLPNWLKWFQTHDSVLDKPDARVAELWGSWLCYKETDSYLIYILKRYVRRVFWLYRNTGYGFRYYVLGYSFNPSLIKVKTISKYGLDFRYDSNPSKNLWNRGWGLYIDYTYCSRFRLNVYVGWKMKSMIIDNRTMYAYRINPFFSTK
jgi:hypothetical protein